jgi:hypothetical protein
MKLIHNVMLAAALFLCVKPAEASIVFCHQRTQIRSFTFQAGMYSTSDTGFPASTYLCMPSGHSGCIDEDSAFADVYVGANGNWTAEGSGGSCPVGLQISCTLKSYFSAGLQALPQAVGTATFNDVTASGQYCTMQPGCPIGNVANQTCGIVGYAGTYDILSMYEGGYGRYTIEQGVPNTWQTTTSQCLTFTHPETSTFYFGGPARIPPSASLPNDEIAFCFESEVIGPMAKGASYQVVQTFQSPACPAQTLTDTAVNSEPYEVAVSCVTY